MSENTEQLPEHAFPLKSLELEQTKIFLSTKWDPRRPMIVSGFRNPGAAIAQRPVLEKLVYGANLCVFADSKGQQVLERAGLDLRQALIEKSALLAISASLPMADAILTGLSDNPGTELTLMANSQYDRLSGLAHRAQVVSLEDYPGSNANWLYRNLNTPYWIIPDYLCVVSEWAKQKELEYLPEWFDPDKVIVTGQPSYDRLAYEDRAGIRQEVRNKLGIGQNEVFLTYMGTVSEGDPIGETVRTLQVLVPTLQKIAPADYRLALRCHPRDTTSPAAYNEIIAPIAEKRVDTTGFTTDQIGIASDIVVSNGSTTGIDAVLRGTPSVNIFVSPNLYFVQSPTSHKEVLSAIPLPTIEDGASPMAINARELEEILGGLLYNPAYRASLQARMDRWKVDGHATDRVTDLVFKIANEHFFQRAGR